VSDASTPEARDFALPDASVRGRRARVAASARAASTARAASAASAALRAHRRVASSRRRVSNRLAAAAAERRAR